MYELHKAEQYFFDGPTLDHLASFVSSFDNPCCLCAPLLGKRIVERGHRVRILDIDDRFEGVPGFVPFDLHRPQWLGEAFDLIVCDPPFYNVSLSQLFTAIRIIAGHDYAQPLLVSYLTRRARNVLGTFSPFNLVATGYRPGYQTVQALERNEIEFFGNLGTTWHERLRGVPADKL
jgi:hypothetical protein